jgi:MFS transporter, DHA1 family, multidrug resistance protein
VYPNAAALCMSPFSKNAGMASALLGFIQIGAGAFISAGTGLLLVNPVLAMAAISFATVFIAAVILGFRKRVPNVAAAPEHK